MDILHETAIDDFIWFIEKNITINKDEENKIRLVYAFADFIHHHQERKDGTKFFEHPKEVARILFEEELNFWEITPKSIIVALLHDIIEDTDVEHYILEALFGKEIADSVQNVSKKHWSLYIWGIPKIHLCEAEKKEIRRVKRQEKNIPLESKFQKRWKKMTIMLDAKNGTQAPEKLETIANLLKIINLKIVKIVLINNIENWVNDVVDAIFKTFWECINDIKLSIDIQEPKEMDRHVLYQKIVTDFPNIKQFAEIERDEEFYGSMSELDDDTLKVKLADRIHNLRTTSRLKKEKISQMIEETEKYFIPITEKRFPQVAIEMQTLITKIKTQHHLP